MADSATVFNVQSAELELNKICENAILGYQNIFDGHIDQHSIFFYFLFVALLSILIAKYFMFDRKTTVHYPKSTFCICFRKVIERSPGIKI